MVFIIWLNHGVVTHTGPTLIEQLISTTSLKMSFMVEVFGILVIKISKGMKLLIMMMEDGFILMMLQIMALLVIISIVKSQWFINLSVHSEIIMDLPFINMIFQQD